MAGRRRIATEPSSGGSDDDAVGGRARPSRRDAGRPSNPAPAVRPRRDPVGSSVDGADRRPRSRRPRMRLAGPGEGACGGPARQRCGSSTGGRVGRANPGQAAASAAGPNGGSSRTSSGHAVGGRRPCRQRAAPSPSRAQIISRRISASPSESAPAQRRLAAAQGAPSNVEGRSAPSTRSGARALPSAPSYERAPRIEPPGRPGSTQASRRRSRSVRMAPTRSPQVERVGAEPIRSCRASSPGATAVGRKPRPARSRNGR